MLILIMRISVGCRNLPWPIVIALCGGAHIWVANGCVPNELPCARHLVSTREVDMYKDVFESVALSHHHLLRIYEDGEVVGTINIRSRAHQML